MSERRLRVRAMPEVEAARWALRLRRLAHDTNNALVPVYAHLELAALGQSSAALDQTRRHLERLRQMAKTLSHAAPRPSGSDDGGTSCHQQLAGEAMAAGVALRWRASAAELAQLGLAADVRDQFLRVAVRNALEAHEAAGPRTDGGFRWVEVAVDTDTDEITLRVHDNGPGCDDLTAAAEGASARAGLGHLGVGLSMAARAAEQAGGALWIATPGEGFVCELAMPRGVAGA